MRLHSTIWHLIEVARKQFCKLFRLVSRIDISLRNESDEVMELKDIAVKTSGWTWDQLREARKLEYQIGEESLTDFLVLNFKKWGRDKISVDTFTKRKEATNGSDWEWWFTGPSGKWLGMRVQAKVINLKSEEYEHIHYKNKYGRQVDLLIEDAARNGMIPLYCLYTNWDTSAYTTPQRCKSHKSSVRHYGASVLNPSIVKSLSQSNGRHLSGFIEQMHPLHCIFCCNGYVDGDLPHRAIGWLVGDQVLTDEESIGVEGLFSFLRDEPPTYVKILMESEVKVYSDFADSKVQRVSIFSEIDSENT